MKRRFTVVVAMTENYTIEVEAEDDDEAYDLAREIAGSVEGQGYSDNDGTFSCVQIEFDEEYELYIEECEDREIEPLREIDEWENHYKKIQIEEEYTDFVNEEDAETITDFDDKKKFIKNAQKRNEEMIKVIFKSGSNAKAPCYLDISNIRGRKSFYKIPYSKYLLDNSWRHKECTSTLPIDKLIEQFDIYDEYIKEIREELALYIIKE